MNRERSSQLIISLGKVSVHRWIVSALQASLKHNKLSFSFNLPTKYQLRFAKQTSLLFLTKSFKRSTNTIHPWDPRSILLPTILRQTLQFLPNHHRPGSITTWQSKWSKISSPNQRKNWLSNTLSLPRDHLSTIIVDVSHSSLTWKVTWRDPHR